MSETISPAEQTTAFLKALDRQADTFAFRVLPEGAGTSVKASNHTGRIIDLQPKLEQMNHQGGGIFVAINEGGRRANEITRVRAVFADTDGAPLMVTTFAAQLPVTPVGNPVTATPVRVPVAA